MIGWVDASSGASGDMVLGALLGAGVPLEVLQDAVSAIAPEPVRLRAERVRRHGFAAHRCRVEVAESRTPRTWAALSTRLVDAGLDRAHAVFARLAEAEGRVHGVPAQDVHFHEVGALDAVADVVGACAGLAHLGVTELVVSPVAVGSGTVRAAHGPLPVPAPAVAELLRGVPSYAGPGSGELCTPTGAALLTTLATSYGPQPAMTTRLIGVGAGARDPGTHANVLRLLLGDPARPRDEPDADEAVLLETNVDDLDPRLWPAALTALLAAGASDAWLTPILMKKGRPAHTLSALVPAARVEEVSAAVFRHTSSIGLRRSVVAKTALERETAQVRVAGRPVRVKVARLGGSVVNVQPEFEDVAAAATATGRTVKELLAEAAAAARTLADPG